MLGFLIPDFADDWWKFFEENVKVFERLRKKSQGSGRLCYFAVNHGNVKMSPWSKKTQWNLQWVYWRAWLGRKNNASYNIEERVEKRLKNGEEIFKKEKEERELKEKELKEKEEKERELKEKEEKERELKEKEEEQEEQEEEKKEEEKKEEDKKEKEQEDKEEEQEQQEKKEEEKKEEDKKDEQEQQEEEKEEEKKKEEKEKEQQEKEDEEDEEEEEKEEEKEMKEKLIIKDNTKEKSDAVKKEEENEVCSINEAGLASNLITTTESKSIPLVLSKQQPNESNQREEPPTARRNLLDELGFDGPSLAMHFVHQRYNDILKSDKLAILDE